ncbi:hypothetical protein [Desulforhopalus sp. IMCC35007]|uniref:hypothetical protein n=1 Tax=Desulforhopalus sp. IMCC35007 TaxID=2569543 RepID=UPI0010AEB188|nr:hypothetical protein [Desulforhopalus sp. IMCC35007]TKB06063.1 hypothetical protein FCL48_22435 [Desulforhopalus sp. IMCC35007]
MIGESGGVTTLIYQEQVSRENQIQRDRSENQEIEENSTSQLTADVTSFSQQGLELARTAVTSAQAAPEAALENESQNNQEMQRSSGAPAQFLDIRA